VRRERDGARVAQLLEELVSVARDESANIMPITIELVRAGASMGDIMEKLKVLWGTYRESPVF
jgi:methylmalonyl-CoA mutase N-terminal domain/subunit